MYRVAAACASLCFIRVQPGCSEHTSLTVPPFAGAGKHGAGALAPFDGISLAAEGACYVSMNYRLGVLGFLAHPAVSAEAENGGVSGNF
eukprot:SAG31_NODE_24122_length_488_cov_3.149100_1_plen_88_part_10